MKSEQVSVPRGSIPELSTVISVPFSEVTGIGKALFHPLFLEEEDRNYRTQFWNSHWYRWDLEGAQSTLWMMLEVPEYLLLLCGR